ncbi:MAG: hypothetical protein U1E76_15595 [Planctomycetota bacterium]
MPFGIDRFYRLRRYNFAAPISTAGSISRRTMRTGEDAVAPVIPADADDASSR